MNSPTPAGPGRSLIVDYLERLRHASADLPADARSELLDGIETHLAETIGNTDEVRVRTVLDDLGSPTEIVAAARAECGTSPARSSSELGYDVVTVLAVLLGGLLIPVLGWLAGVIMLWNGPRWSRRDKWLGTLIWPVVLAAAALTLLGSRGGGLTELGVLSWTGVLAVITALTVTFGYLLRAAATPRPTTR